MTFKNEQIPYYSVKTNTTLSYTSKAFITKFFKLKFVNIRKKIHDIYTKAIYDFMYLYEP